MTINPQIVSIRTLRCTSAFKLELEGPGINQSGIDRPTLALNPLLTNLLVNVHIYDLTLTEYLTSKGSRKLVLYLCYGMKISYYIEYSMGF